MTTAARVAAIRHVDMSEAAGPADAAGPTSAAMRIMIDAAARRAAAGAGGTRPGSAAGDAPPPAGTGRPASSASGEVQGEAVGQAAAPMPPAAPAGPSAAVAAEGAGPAVDSTAPVDTKSLRRLIEDMKRRGWQLLVGACSALPAGCLRQWVGSLFRHQCLPARPCLGRLLAGVRHAAHRLHATPRLSDDMLGRQLCVTDLSDRQASSAAHAGCPPRLRPSPCPASEDCLYDLAAHTRFFCSTRITCAYCHARCSCNHALH